MKTYLTTSRGFNPFHIDGKIVNSLNFYKDGKVLASCRWFGNYNNYRSIEFDFEVKKALRLNLGRKDAFYMLSDEKSAFGREYKVYIYADLVGLEDCGRTDYYNTWYQTSTRQTFTVRLHGERWKYEKAEPSAETNWQDFRRVAVMGDYVEKFDSNYIFTDTPEKKRCDVLAARIKEKTNVELSCFQVHDILEHFSIKEKK